jgi:hypothetical protein
VEENDGREDRLTIGKVNLPRQRTAEFLAENMKPGDVVMINVTGWALNQCLATVEEVKSWGLMAYVQLPRSGVSYEILGLAYMKDTMRAYVRIGWDQFINITGGTAAKNHLWNHDND